MLNVGRKICRRLADARSLFDGDALSHLLKFGTDERNPSLGRYFLQKHQVAELVKWHALVVEDVFHPMFLTPEHAISDLLLMLPDGTKFFLEGDGIGKICHLLELVQTHDKADVLLLSNLRWQLQDVRFGIVLRFPSFTMLSATNDAAAPGTIQVPNNL